MLTQERLRTWTLKGWSGYNLRNRSRVVKEVIATCHNNTLSSAATAAAFAHGNNEQKAFTIAYRRSTHEPLAEDWSGPAWNHIYFSSQPLSAQATGCEYTRNHSAFRGETRARRRLASASQPPPHAGRACPAPTCRPIGRLLRLVGACSASHGVLIARGSRVVDF